MTTNEKFGYLNKGFLRSNIVGSNLAEGEGFENVKSAIYGTAVGNSADSAATFRGFVLKVLPEGTLIPAGLLNVLKSQSQTENDANMVQVYVRVPELHGYLEKPEDEFGPTVTDHALCVGPPIGYQFGNVVTVAFNDVYSTSFGTIDVGAGATIVVPSGSGDEIPWDGTAAVLPGMGMIGNPLADEERFRMAKISNGYALRRALGGGKQISIKDYIKREFVSFEKMKPALKQQYAPRPAKPPLIARNFLESLLKSYQLQPTCFWKRLWIGESGLRPTGVFNQFLYKENEPNKTYRLAAALDDRSRGPCTGIGIGATQISEFYGTEDVPSFNNYAIRAAHFHTLQPVPYGIHQAVFYVSRLASHQPIECTNKSHKANRIELFGKKANTGNKCGILYNLVRNWVSKTSYEVILKRMKAGIKACKKDKKYSKMSNIQAANAIEKDFNSTLKNVRRQSWTDKLTGAVDLLVRVPGAPTQDKNLEILCKQVPKKYRTAPKGTKTVGQKTSCDHTDAYKFLCGKDDKTRPKCV